MDLEQHLINNKHISSKCINSEIYCQELYAALCNNQFFYGDKSWTCSWRMSGGIVADIIKRGDYMDWYCSGNEGFVTDEIKLDLMMMGWTVKDHDEYMKDCRKLLKELNNEEENF